MKALVKERTVRQQEFDHIEEITFGDELAKGKITFTGPTIKVEFNGLILIERQPEDEPLFHDESATWAFRPLEPLGNT